MDVSELFDRVTSNLVFQIAVLCLLAIGIVYMWSR